MEVLAVCLCHKEKLIEFKLSYGKMRESGCSRRMPASTDVVLVGMMIIAACPWAARGKCCCCYHLYGYSDDVKMLLLLPLIRIQ